jgi:hypothetical protein
MDQPTLFEGKQGDVPVEQVILFALGDFQSRGKVLANRELPLDRLLGAFRRAIAFFNKEGLQDTLIATCLKSMGASVREVPTFVAKHPFRIVVPEELAEKGRAFYATKLREARSASAS